MEERRKKDWFNLKVETPGSVSLRFCESHTALGLMGPLESKGPASLRTLI